MSKELERRKEELRTQYSSELFRLGKLVAVTPEARDLYRNFSAATTAAQTAADRTRETVARLRADDTMNPAGKQRLIREALEAGKAEVTKQHQRMDACIKVIGAHLQEVAQPRLPKDREMAARDEMRLLLDNAPSPASAMAELATRDDEVGGVAVSSYGESYLRARGTHNAKELHGQVRAAAAQAAVSSSNEQRRAAGLALREMGAGHDIGGLKAIANTLANFALGDAEHPSPNGGDE